MGCDIHYEVERLENGVWAECAVDVELGRSYETFARLAGVRNPGNIRIPIPPRGLPPGREDPWLTDPDSNCHSHSWLTVDEFAEVLSESPDPGAFGHLLAVMRRCGEGGCPVRLVFWFNN